jgi:hypothetical protein
MYYLGICLEELRKKIKTPSEDSRYHGRDSNREPPEPKFRALRLDQSVWLIMYDTKLLPQFASKVTILDTKKCYLQLRLK